MSAVAPPEDEEDVLHRREATGVTVSSVLLGLAILCGGAAVVLLEHVALLEVVVNRRLVVRAGLLEHVVEYAGASRSRSRALSRRVNCEGLVPVVVASLRARLATRLLALLVSLVFLLGLLGLAALRGRVVHALAFLGVKDGPHRFLTGSKAGGDVEQLIGVDRQAALEFTHEVPAGRTLEECMHDLGLGDARELSTTLGEASYEVPERLAGLLGAHAHVLGVLGAHVCAMEVPHEGADQVVPVVDLAGRQVFEPSPRRVCEV
jgi:hypothetical protein